jgi:hypothetical protein
MNIVRNLFCTLAAIAISALAMPGMAAKPAAQPQKLYNLEFLLPPTDPLLSDRDNPLYDPATEQLVPPVAVTVTVKNESPPQANSNISSFQFTLSGLIVFKDGLTCPNARCTVDDATNTVFVTNISPPIQTQQSLIVTLHVSSCVAVGEASIAPLVFSGSQVNGDPFDVYDSKTRTDASFPMVTTLSTRTGPDTAPTITTTGILCGNIACGDPPLVVPESFGTCGSDPADPRCVTTSRGTDKNGACSATPIDYAVTNLLPSSKSLHFVWDTNTAPSATFAYRLNGAFPSTVPPAAPSPPPWQVAWLTTTTNGVPGPAFIAAQECLGADLTNFPPAALPLPAPYGTLAAAIKAGDKSIKVNLSTSQFPSLPFPIVIDAERMNVTKITTNTWTVDRDKGATQHLLNANVMSTPLRLVLQSSGPYVAGSIAQVCRASLSHDNGDGTWSAWFIDIGDGWVTIPH